MSFRSVEHEHPPEGEPDQRDASDDVKSRFPAGVRDKGPAHWEGEDKTESCPEEASSDKRCSLLKRDPSCRHRLQRRKCDTLEN